MVATQRSVSSSRTRRPATRASGSLASMNPRSRKGFLSRAASLAAFGGGEGRVTGSAMAVDPLAPLYRFRRALQTCGGLEQTSAGLEQTRAGLDRSDLERGHDGRVIAGADLRQDLA